MPTTFYVYYTFGINLSKCWKKINLFRMMLSLWFPFVFTNEAGLDYFLRLLEHSWRKTLGIFQTIIKTRPASFSTSTISLSLLPSWKIFGWFWKYFFRNFQFHEFQFHTQKWRNTYKSTCKSIECWLNLKKSSVKLNKKISVIKSKSMGINSSDTWIKKYKGDLQQNAFFMYEWVSKEFSYARLR